ncbi:TetR/AcrR family transcriptional regulator [Microbacterium sp. CJ88]|uniref:TetR/AcrR family transcriptional regulator n=1 Tax=Microbacterium sp. CJ88 TaxID=3445672 RepID=UPI003F658C63
MTDTTVRRRGRGVSAGLTRERILDATARLVDDRGFDAVSVRSVAAALGVSPAAIYNHITDRSDLVDALAYSFVEREMLTGMPDDLDDLDAVREMARRLHRAGCRHPSLLLAIIGHRPEHVRTAQQMFGERMVGHLLAAGATVAQAQLVYRVLLSLAAGAAAGVRNLARPSRVSVAERMERQLAASDDPVVARVIHTMPELGDEAAFEDQIELALAPITAAGGAR